MNTIHKIAAIAIKDNKFFMVRKKGKDIWTNLGGKPEGNETEEEALKREIKEEIDCDSKIVKKLGDFESKAVFDDATLVLSTYLVEIIGNPVISDDELEEYTYVGHDYKSKGIKLPPSITEGIIPYLVKNGYLTNDFLAKK